MFLMFALFQMLLLCLLAVGSALRIELPEVDPEAAVDGIFSRLPQWIGASFTVSIRPHRHLREGGVSVRVLPDGQKAVVAESIPDAMYGLNRFLRQHCGTQVTWDGASYGDGDCDDLPAGTEYEWEAPVIRWFGNPCTYSYSFAWWRWEDWERFLDWAVLNGFNMMLAPNGQEAVWAEVWREMGVSQAGLDQHFTGPAFLAWHRMGNLRAYGGPVSPEFQRQQLQLNMKIVERMTELGIVPVLPTFAGFVPEELVELYPELSIHRSSCWLDFNSTHSCLPMIDPNDPMFVQIAEAFIQKQREIYGHVTHVYSADAFNEIPPSGADTKFLSDMSRAIYTGCAAGDSKCVWVLQAWMLQYDGWTKPAARAFLDPVPRGKMLVLDLYAEHTPTFRKFDGFFGHSFIWCVLHNFGGKTEMRGNLKSINKDYGLSRGVAAGAGLAMEAINQNYIVYQFAIDRWWSDRQIDIQQWLVEYTSSRYGVQSSLAHKAWLSIVNTIYSEPKLKADVRFDVFIYDRPHFAKYIKYWYEPTALKHVLEKYLLPLNKTIGRNPLFRKDLLDVRREWVQFVIGNRIIQRMYEAYGINDTTTLKQSCFELDEAFRELEEVANTDEIGWEKAAWKLGSTLRESALFAANARDQLTLWGPNQNGSIRDYAKKEWSHLISSYYRPRWRLFCKHLLRPSKFRQAEFNREVFETVERPFSGLSALASPTLQSLFDL